MFRILLVLTLTFGVVLNAESQARFGQTSLAQGNSTTQAQPPMADELLAASGGPTYSIEQADISAPGQLARISHWNLFNTPSKNGFSHYLPSMGSIEISGPGGAVESAPRSGKKSPVGQVMYTPGGDLVWSASVQVEGSDRLRLNLTDVDLPIGAKLWVYGSKGDSIGPFGLELADSKNQIWTPAVSGPEISLVAVVPRGSSPARFQLNRVLQLFRLNSFGEPILQPEEDPPKEDTSCLLQSLCVDTNVFAPIVEVERAIGAMEFVVGGEGSVCTGGLVADTDTSTNRLLFLTANHCFSTQDVASTLQVYWDFGTAACQQEPPDKYASPSSQGSTLLATGAAADYTLLELNAVPDNRHFLPFNKDPSAAAPGATLHRVSHPHGKEHHYSQTTVNTGTHQCGDAWSDATHIWQSFVQGSTLGGSSGSPVLTASGEIVGQLSGTCTSDEEPPNCRTEPTIDGRLSSYFNEVAQFLDPSSGGNESADLSVATVEVQQGTYKAGDSFPVNVQVNNVGSAASSGYTVNYYASSDTNITGSDISLGSVNRDAVAAGASDAFQVNITLTSGLPDGNYYIGVIVTPSDSNGGNNTGRSNVTITMTGGSSGGGVNINAGMNGSWYNASMSGQGILIDVLTGSNQMFAAWFTFEVQRPPAEYQAILGEPGLRWMTALGPISGNKATLTVYLANGGVFAQSQPPVTQAASGTITLTFHDCKNATLEYNINGVGSGTIELIRLTFDAVATCEAGQ